MRLNILIAAVLGTLAVSLGRLKDSIAPKRISALRRRVALPNELGLMNEHGIETLVIDPASTFPNTKYLLYMRGAAANYAIMCDGNSGTAKRPLGPSSDSPVQVGDFLNIRRLGRRPGLELGIPTNAAITIDNLVYAAAAGKIADLTLAGNGTYWVVGRAIKTTAAGAAEAAYAPCEPYQITVSNGGGTYAYAGAGQ